jgi:hypothetical protein
VYDQTQGTGAVFSSLYVYLYYKSTNLFLVCLSCWGTGGSLILESFFITLKGLEVFLWFQKFPKKTTSARIRTRTKHSLILFFQRFSELTDL